MQAAECRGARVRVPVVGQVSNPEIETGLTHSERDLQGRHL